MSTTRSVPRSPRPPRRRRRAAAGALVAVAALVTGCGDDSDAGDASAASTSATDGATAREAASITVTDGWVKAVDSGMTAAFGEIANTSDADITIVSATTAVSDTVELHETVTNDDGTLAMQPKEGGFVVPAGGTLTLEPGGNHIMFMGVNQELVPDTIVNGELSFEKAGKVKIEFMIEPAGTAHSMDNM